MTTAGPLPVVWVVDDSPLEAEICRRALAPTCQIESFGEAHSVLERLATGAMPDVLVIDWLMPQMSGLELCQFVRRSHEVTTLPIIVLTATRHREDLLAALGAGANDYVMKPFDAEELAARVATVIQMKRMNAELLRTAEFRERFIGILGHDLRQPLSTLTLGTAILMSRELSEGDAKTVRRVHAATNRMSRMIADLLDLTRTRLGSGIPVDRRAMDLMEKCREVVEEVQIANPERSIVLECSGDGRGAWDGDRIQQVCTNLIGNALAHGSATAPVRVTVSGEGAQVTLAVENSGPAIPTATRAALFDPFRSGAGGGSSTRQGLGLGLFIVQEIARCHGGTVAVESDDARTVFTVRLPREAAGVA